VSYVPPPPNAYPTSSGAYNAYPPQPAGYVKQKKSGFGSGILPGMKLFLYIF
jgi:hypothetical protein